MSNVSRHKMPLDRTKALLSGALKVAEPKALLGEVLAASIELVSLEDNDFAWSSWEGKAAAVQELEAHLATLHSGNRLDLHSLSVLFAPTGPMQELSLSSGWGEAFVKLASYFDMAEAGLKA
jgi:hypothetical protein